MLVDYKTYKLSLETLAEKTIQNRKRIEKAPSIISPEDFQFLKFSEDEVQQLEQRTKQFAETLRDAVKPTILLTVSEGEET